MPFLRFSRDKRGYEHFYLVHVPSGRRGKGRPRILFWFRTPPNVKVGRRPFPEDVRRMLESTYPNIVFEWDKLEATPIPPADVERWRERRRAEREARQAPRVDAAAAAEPDEEVVEETADAGEQGGDPGTAGPDRSGQTTAEPVKPESQVSRPGGAPRRRRRRGGRRPGWQPGGPPATQIRTGGEHQESTATSPAVESSGPAAGRLDAPAEPLRSSAEGSTPADERSRGAGTGSTSESSSSEDEV